jgi:hypothetical protein
MMRKSTFSCQHQTRPVTHKLLFKKGKNVLKAFQNLKLNTFYYLVQATPLSRTCNSLHCPDVFEWDFDLPKPNCHPHVCLNGLTPAGMLLADWLVCERYALAYSCTK